MRVRGADRCSGLAAGLEALLAAAYRVSLLPTVEELIGAAPDGRPRDALPAAGVRGVMGNGHRVDARGPSRVARGHARRRRASQPQR